MKINISVPQSCTYSTLTYFNEGIMYTWTPEVGLVFHMNPQTFRCFKWTLQIAKIVSIKHSLKFNLSILDACRTRMLNNLKLYDVALYFGYVSINVANKKRNRTNAKPLPEKPKRI